MFDAKVREHYAVKVQQALLNKSHFTLVEALEETMDSWSVGRNMFTIPNYNTYIPVKNTIMKKPSMNGEFAKDEMGFRWNNRNTDRSADKTEYKINPVG